MCGTIITMLRESLAQLLRPVAVRARPLPGARNPFCFMWPMLQIVTLSRSTRHFFPLLYTTLNSQRYEFGRNLQRSDHVFLVSVKTSHKGAPVATRHGVPQARMYPATSSPCFLECRHRAEGRQAAKPVLVAESPIAKNANNETVSWGFH